MRKEYYDISRERKIKNLVKARKDENGFVDDIEIVIICDSNIYKTKINKNVRFVKIEDGSYAENVVVEKDVVLEVTRSSLQNVKISNGELKLVNSCIESNFTSINDADNNIDVEIDLENQAIILLDYIIKLKFNIPRNFDYSKPFEVTNIDVDYERVDYNEDDDYDKIKTMKIKISSIKNNNVVNKREIEVKVLSAEPVLFGYIFLSREIIINVSLRNK